MTGDRVARLQCLVLEALLAGRPLPGGVRPVTLPDVPAFLPPEQDWPLSRENVADPSRLPAGVQVVSPAELSGDAAHLRFGLAERDGDTICLTLEIWLRGVPLSGTRACFRPHDDGWTAAGDPVVYSN